MRARHVVGLLILLLLAGCGEGDPTVSGTGYKLKLAHGWGPAKKQFMKQAATQVAVPGVRLDLLIGRTDTSRANVNVIRANAPGGTTLDVVNKLGRGGLRSLGASNITTTRSAAIDRDRAITYKYDGRSPAGRALRSRLVAVLHGGHVLTITLTAQISSFDGANQDFSSMLRSWHWE